MLSGFGSTTQGKSTNRQTDAQNVDVFARFGFVADLHAILENLTSKPALAGSARPAPALADARPAGDISRDEFIRLSNVLIAQKTGGRSTSATPSGFARLADAVKQFAGSLPEPTGSTTAPADLPALAVRFDPEMARIATITGVFPLYRAWLYIRANGDGSGKMARDTVAAVWQAAGVATSDRHVRRLIKNGDGVFWHVEKCNQKRLYAAGVERLAARLFARAQDVVPDTLATNTPGNRRDMLADLSGDIGTAQAVVYAAWISSKSDKRGGVTIARDTLCRLWRVSVPTLLSWENAARVGKQANYAQAPDNSTATAPAHAYLNLHRDGSTFLSWRLPNTYYVRSKVRRHEHTGKARKVRQTVQQIADTAQRGFDEDAALPVQTKRYFVDTEKTNAFKAAETYVRRVARKDGDIYTRRYFAVGMRHNVAIFEPYDHDTTYQKTHIAQRNIWQEMRTAWFLLQRRAFSFALADAAKWR
jgi:hypothetical protein